MSPNAGWHWLTRPAAGTWENRGIFPDIPAPRRVGKRDFLTTTQALGGSSVFLEGTASAGTITTKRLTFWPSFATGDESAIRDAYPSGSAPFTRSLNVDLANGTWTEFDAQETAGEKGRPYAPPCRRESGPIKG